jgi:hypothetical protein
VEQVLKFEEEPKEEEKKPEKEVEASQPKKQPSRNGFKKVLDIFKQGTFDFLEQATKDDGDSNDDDN